MVDATGVDEDTVQAALNDRFDPKSKHRTRISVEGDSSSTLNATVGIDTTKNSWVGMNSSDRGDFMEQVVSQHK